MTAKINENTQFLDETTNTPINNGYIYIGTDGLDAKINPITIYSDRDLTTALTNPQRTGSDGRTLNKIFIPGRYSMKIENSANVQKLNDLSLGELAQTGNTILDNVLGTDAVTADASPTITTLVNNQVYIFTAANTNTGAMTLTIDATATLSIVKNHDIALVAGDVEADQTVLVVYNETDTVFELVSMSAIRSAMITGDEFTGNVGINSTLKDWDAIADVLQMGSRTTLSEIGDTQTWLTRNAFYDDTLNDWAYMETDEAQAITFAANGSIIFYTAVSGTAGNAITWVEAGRFNVSGTFLAGLGISSLPPTTAGSATVYTATLGVTAYETDRVYEVQVDEVNTGSFTMNFDAIGAKNVKLLDGNDPVAGQFAAVMIAKLLYDGTNLVLLNPAFSFRGALVYMSANQTISHATFTDVGFDTEDYDTDAIHDTVTNNTRLTVPTGITRIKLWGQVVWDPDSTGNNRLISFNKNGSGFIGSSRTNAIHSVGDAASYVGQISSPVLVVAATDYFELGVYQDSGGNLDVEDSYSAIGGFVYTAFSMEIIG